MNNIKEKNNIPELRFPEFSGEWKKNPAGEIFENYSNKNHSGDLPLLAATQENGIVFRDDLDLKINSSVSGILNYKIIEPGNFVISLRSFQGGIEYSKIRGISSPAYTVLKSKINISDYFYKYLFKKESFINELNSLIYGIRDGKQISFNEFKTLKLPYPAVEEQKKIAEFLGSVDVWIENLENQKKTWENYKKGMMQKLFPTNDQKVPELRFKDKNGNDFPAWEEKKLEDVGNFRSGIGFSEREQGGKFGIPFFKVSDMNLPGNEYEMSRANNYVSKKQVEDLNYAIFEKPSIIFAKVGAAIFLERKRIAENFLIDNNMMAFTPDKNINFYKYIFEEISLSKYAQVGALPSYGSSDLKSIKIQSPVLSEQKKIVNFLGAIDDVIMARDQEIAKAREWRKGLMQKIFV